MMNEKNLKDLKDQIRQAGFGEMLEAALKQNIKKQQSFFILKHYTFFGKNKVYSELNFQREYGTKLYFFSLYKIQLYRNENTKYLEHIFYFDMRNTITLKEAYNLLEGRSVSKDSINNQGEVHSIWMQMDFGQSKSDDIFKLSYYPLNYDYDLETAFVRSSIGEFNDPTIIMETAVLDSLKKGNLQSVLIEKSGILSKFYIEANPHGKSINVYDTNKLRLNTNRPKNYPIADTESNTPLKSIVTNH